jgi:hypothetical protein
MPRMIRKTPLAVRFARKLVIPSDPDACWGWMGTTDEKGYGRIGRGGRGAGVCIASRVSYEIHIGPVPPGMWVLHHCDNPPCCNPRHLWLGTNQDNVDDMVRKGRQRSVGSPGDRNGARLYPERIVRGEDLHLSKLDAAAVRSIRDRHASKQATTRELADEYGVNVSTIRRILRRETWAHIP